MQPPDLDDPTYEAVITWMDPDTGITYVRMDDGWEPLPESVVTEDDQVVNDEEVTD